MKPITYFLLSVIFSLKVYCQTDSMVVIKGGKFLPLYGTSSEVDVTNFKMDVYPVTNADFLKFVKSNPQWKKSEVKGIFSDEDYLEYWEKDENFGKNRFPNSPVTNVSWFAAKSYCECMGKRLPTVNEWEYVAMSNAEVKDARQNEAYNKTILSWYETPSTYKNIVGNGTKNYWGVYDLFGMVWEWTYDFNSVMVSANSKDNNLYCDAGTFTTSDLMNYAAFMRYAFRSSLEGKFTIKNLGFRCVQDI
ncbi:MAG TPA: formylglycine-generating enzyme family protein [Salinimicrobium sp.]|nr:formylglycine-generating enzyme family protein [Salinimicrobium sp.]